ncbi:hypothetical protein [Akkermansia sp.]|uniref:hypothetical protein n=1 Tax=Akkermansia sp. TaxID=1872421 RepID=UPI0025C65ECE|nr:hypothetical protein [Akkermansia sp.]
MKYIKRILFTSLFVFVPFAGYSKGEKSMDPVDEGVKKELEFARSAMKLVLLEHIESVEEIKAAQDAYLDKHFKGYEFRGGHVYGMLRGLYLHGITVFNRKGPAKTVFFDMTDIYKKLEQSSDEETRAKVRELMRRHGDTKK